jgi:hypothetical protein
MNHRAMRLATPRRLGMAAAVLTFAAAGAAWAYTTDTDSRGTITNISGGKRFAIQQRTDSVPGRAELRGSSSTSGVSAAGRFKLVSGGKYVSVMQVLNVVASGQTSGPSEPITQLAVRPKSGGNYEFYIVQGSQVCSGAPTVVPGNSYDVSVSVSTGQTPGYMINGISCKKSNPDGDKAGTVYDNGLKSGRHFYAKMGAYNTSSNQSNNGGSTTIEWTEINI